MAPEEEIQNRFTQLRRIAKEKLDNSPKPVSKNGDINQLIYELQVHQIELETQNEELVSAQKSISELKRKYEELFDSAPVGYVVLDNNYIITEINRKGKHMLSEPEEYILGSPLSRYVDSQFRKGLYRQLEDIIMQGHTQGFEIKLLTGDTSAVWVLIEITFAKSITENSHRLFVTMNDITEKKQKDMQLKRSRKEYYDIVETANSIIAKMDTEGTLSFLNQYGLDFFGFDREEIIGKPAIGTIIPENSTPDKKWSRFIEAMLKNPEAFQDVKNENIKADGTPVWIHWRNKATVDAEGYITGILSIGRDITEEKIAEEVIKRDNEELETLVKRRTEQFIQVQKDMEQSRRFADLGRLSSSIAHELRRPLAAIKLSTYNIRKKRTNPAIDKNLDHCEEKIAEADEIISSILKSQLLNKQELQRIDFGEMVSESLDRFELSAVTETKKENNRGINRDLAILYSVKIEVDPIQMNEVIFHILQNACEATGWELNKVSVVGFNSGETTGFKVIDRNLGIPQEEIPMITEPFFTTKHQGLGLGLTVAQKIIDRHDGTLDIESSIGAGTTVTVTLPKKI